MACGILPPFFLSSTDNIHLGENFKNLGEEKEIFGKVFAPGLNPWIFSNLYEYIIVLNKSIFVLSKFFAQNTPAWIRKHCKAFRNLKLVWYNLWRWENMVKQSMINFCFIFRLTVMFNNLAVKKMARKRHPTDRRTS